MRTFLKDRYNKLKEAYLNEINFIVPKIYQSVFVHFGGGAEVQFIVRRFLRAIPPPAKILIVGVMGGRDYFMLRNAGYEVVALDLGEQPEIEPVVVSNVEDPLPFADETFDVVLIFEVLEHLKEDVRALTNIRQVLKANGRLIVSLPFYHDAEDGHMRIHSPKSGERLLRMSGFAVEDYLERPGFFWFRGLNTFQHGLSLISHAITGRTIYPWSVKLLGGAEWSLGHVRWLRPARRLSNCFGGYYLCSKAKHFDYLELNKRLYTGGRGRE